MVTVLNCWQHLSNSDLSYMQIVQWYNTLSLSLSLSLSSPLYLTQGCDLIVALTHMRVPNDVRLAEAVPEIHLILGGHDHHYEERWVSHAVQHIQQMCDILNFSARIDMLVML